jgi:hypothetical protein
LPLQRSAWPLRAESLDESRSGRPQVLDSTGQPRLSPRNIAAALPRLAKRSPRILHCASGGLKIPLSYAFGTAVLDQKDSAGHRQIANI